jgi:16S rRNA (cytosine967-C5)-methyltransferase
MIMKMSHGVSGMVSAIDLNEGRLRIVKETAKLHQVDSVITTIHADLRTFAVNYHKTLCKAGISFGTCNFSHAPFLLLFLFILQEKNPVKGDKVLLDAPCSGLGVLSKVVYEPCVSPCVFSVSSF